MQIKLNGQTRLKQALDAIPGALDYTVSLNPRDFKRLFNPFMRKYMSPRISLERVAAMAGTPLSEMLAELHRLAGEPPAVLAEDESTRTTGSPLPQSPATPPGWMKLAEHPDFHWINLLPLDETLGDPLPPIIVAIKNMPPGGAIGIKHRWEPQPLYDIWRKMQLEWYACQFGPEEWHIFIYKPPKLIPTAPDPVIYVELRHLPPQEAVLRVTLMFDQLRPGQRLEISGANQQTEPLVRQAFEKDYPGLFEWQIVVENDKKVIKVNRRPFAEP